MDGFGAGNSLLPPRLHLFGLSGIHHFTVGQTGLVYITMMYALSSSLSRLADTGVSKRCFFPRIFY